MTLRRTEIIAALERGPKTNRQIQEFLKMKATGASVARTMASLIDLGLVRRADTARGAGHPATYELVKGAPKTSPGIDWEKHRAKIIRLMEQGSTYAVIADRLGSPVTENGLKSYARREGLLVHKAKPVVVVEPKPEKKPWRNPLKDINTWRPPADLTTLDAAVTSLRAKLKVPVFAEETRRYPNLIPKPYGPETLFRIGSLCNVPADQVLAMADEIRRAA